MTTIPTSKVNPDTVMPRASSRAGGSGAAPLRGSNARLLQQVMFIAGAAMLPIGLIVIVLGWYGASHTPYLYDQLSYLVSGGQMGVGLTFCGGFLYFGSWLAKIAEDQKSSSARLADTLLTLSDSNSHLMALLTDGAEGGRRRDARSVLVTAGAGHTLHRADCQLVAGRNDVQVAGPDSGHLTACRLCMPEVGM